MKPIEQNQYLIAAMCDYLQARKMVMCGLLGNASRQRETLRAVYRLIKG